MCSILYIASSPRGGASYSNQIAQGVINDLRERDANARLVVRNLAQAPLPHIDDDFVAATRGPGGPQTDKQRSRCPMRSSTSSWPPTSS
jgi:FMN-dependent NADH-azoreductase